MWQSKSSCSAKPRPLHAQHRLLSLRFRTKHRPTAPYWTSGQPPGTADHCVSLWPFTAGRHLIRLHRDRRDRQCDPTARGAYDRHFPKSHSLLNIQPSFRVKRVDVYHQGPERYVTKNHDMVPRIAVIPYLWSVACVGLIPIGERQHICKEGQQGALLARSSDLATNILVRIQGSKKDYVLVFISSLILFSAKTSS